MVLEETMRVPWTAKRSNKSILKLNPEYALEGHYIDTEPPRKPLVTSLSLIFLCDSCMYEIKIVFPLFFNVSLIIGTAQKPRKEEGKLFLPLQLLGWMFQSAIEGLLTYFSLTFGSAVNNFVGTVTDFILGGSKTT